MIQVLLGLVFGLFIGIGTGLIPGLNLGLIFLYYFSSDNVHTEFLFALGITAAISNAIVSQINMLTPIAIGTEAQLIGPMEKLIKKGQGVRALMEYYLNYMFAIWATLFIFVCIYFTRDMQSDFKVAQLMPLLAIIGAYVWIRQITVSKNPLIAALIVIVVAILGFIVINKFPINSMLIWEHPTYALSINA